MPQPKRAHATTSTQPHDFEAAYTEWRDQVSNGLKPLQETLIPLFQKTQLFRVYSSSLVPGLLQTECYAAAVLRVVPDLRDLPFDDSVEAARARVERSRVIHDAGRRFVLLIEEAVLYYNVGDRDTLAGQLRHLLTVGDLPSVSFGIIPTTTRARSQWPHETFHVYDDSRVSVELISAQVAVTQPAEVSLYTQAFAQLESMAVYDDEARRLVQKALESLN